MNIKEYVDSLPQIELYSCVGFGDRILSVKITVAGTDLPNFEDEKNKEIMYAAYDAGRGLENAIKSAQYCDRPEIIVNRKREKDELLNLFDDKIFVEEIPNGYSPEDPYYSQFPWFIVTTPVGHFKIGWRKRVIELDWSRTVGTGKSEELFPDETTTKGERYIHAWSLEKARGYICKIIESSQYRGRI